MRRIFTGAVCVIGLLATGDAAHAQDNGTCRASAARVTLPGGLGDVEPVRANAPGTPCSSQSAAVAQPTTVGPVKADAVGAFTDRAGAAFASAAHAAVTLGPLAVTATAVEATAAAPCGGTATGTSRVVGLTVNGSPVVVPPGDAPVNIPLGPLGSISLNKEIADNGTLTRRAVEIVSPAGTVVLAEAIAKPGTCPGAANPVPPVCPDGATFDPERNVCVIREGDDGNTNNGGGGNGGGGSGNGSNGGGSNGGGGNGGEAGNGGGVTTGQPFEGPSGGTVITIEDARKRFKSPCLKGSGPEFAVVGTNGRDNITGTNERDRILLLGGRDNSEGGRGDDCIDGGKGTDTMSGALGKDRIVGGSGGDHLVGGSAADFLQAGSGNDTINAGFGKDRIEGGKGADRINAATAGPASRKIKCGKGKDKIRVNRNEKKRARKGGCERVYVIR